MMELLVLALGALVAVGGWAYLFRRPPEGLWPRTWVVAGVLSAYALVGLAVTDELATVLGPVDIAVVGLGLGVGAAWLVATHIGHAVLCRLVPGFLDQVTELYSLRTGDRVAAMVGPVTAMAVAEELAFRGLAQTHLGLAGAVIAYGLVQFVAGKWALVLAAVLGGVVWGVLFWWTGGLVAPVLAHWVWTASLTFLWPLRGCGAGGGGADAAPTADQVELRDAGSGSSGSVVGRSEP